MGKVVVFGSMNTDLIIQTKKLPKTGETVSGGRFLISQGGKGANQAIAASKLGAQVELVACLGNDTFGKSSYQNLSNSGVGTNYVRFVSERVSSVAFIIQMNRDNRIVLGEGSNDELKCEDFLYYLKQDGSAYVFVAQFETPKEEVLKALKLAKKQGMYTILNPTPAERLEKEVFSDIDLMILNQTESEVVSGIYPRNRSDCRRVYQELQKNGLKNLIITLGKIGSVVFEHGALFVMEGYSVESVDSTGAGDTYIGAVAYGLSCKMKLKEACKLASAAAALSVTKMGAQEGMPTLEETQKFMEDYTYYGQENTNHH